jgi:hypothetical protein
MVAAKPFNAVFDAAGHWDINDIGNAPSGGGGGSFSAWQGTTGSIAINSSTFTTIFTISVPASLAAGACWPINFKIYASTSTLSSVQIQVDGSVVLNSLGLGGPAGIYTWLNYCNNSAVQNAQSILIKDAGYFTSATQGLLSSTNEYTAPGNVIAATTNVDLSTSSHTITILAEGSAGNAQGLFVSVGN